jgi:hypothetical protein
MKNFLFVCISFFMLSCSSNSTSQMFVDFDEFNESTTYDAIFESKEKSGIVHTYSIKFIQKNDKTFSTYFRVYYSSDEWLFIKSLQLKNMESGWSKDFEWDYFDRKSEIDSSLEFFPLSEWILIPVSLDTAIELLSQESFTSRIYGDKYYSESQVAQSVGTKELLNFLNSIDDD